MGRCSRHPHHVLVGVCAYCLNEQLSDVLDQAHHRHEDSLSHTHMRSQTSLSFGSSNATTTCGTVPETPRWRALHNLGSNDATPFPSVHPHRADHIHRQPVFFSPQHQLNVSRHRTLMPLRNTQHSVENHPFIREEFVHRKKKSSLWSFLKRQRQHYSCGMGNWHELEDVGEDYVYIDHHHGGMERRHRPGTSGARVSSQHNNLREPTCMSGTRTLGDGINSRVKLLSSVSTREQIANRVLQERVTNAEFLSLPNTMLSKQSKQWFKGVLSPRAERGMGKSALRSEMYGIGDEALTLWQCTSHAVNCQNSSEEYDRHGVECDEGPRKMNPMLPLERVGTRKPTSSLDAAGFSQPIIELIDSPSPDITPRFKGEGMDSPGSMPSRLSSTTLLGLGTLRAPPEMGRQPPGRPRNLGPKNKFLQSILSKSAAAARHEREDGTTCEVACLSDCGSPQAFESSDTCTIQSPQPGKHPSLFARKRSQRVTGKDTTILPLSMLAIEKDDSSHCPAIGHSCERVSPHHDGFEQYQVHMLDTTVPRDGIHEAGLEDNSSPLPSDDEHLQGPFASSLKEHLKSPKQGHTLKADNVEAMEEHGSYEMHPPQSKRSWRKAIAKKLYPMLAIGSKKKQDSRLTNDGQYDHPHHVDNIHQYDEDDACEREYGDQPRRHHNPQNQEHLHHIYKDNEEAYARHHARLDTRGCNKAISVLQEEPHHVLLSLDDDKGSPQPYSFLSRDYSALSFYLSTASRVGGEVDHVSRKWRGHEYHDEDLSSFVPYSVTRSRADIGSRSGRGRF